MFQKEKNLVMENEKNAVSENKVYLGNLKYEVTEDDLKNFFDEKGIAVKSVSVITDKFSGRSKGFGFAEFETDDEVKNAIETLNGADLHGRPLRVNKAERRKSRRDSFSRGGNGGGSRFNSRF